MPSHYPVVIAGGGTAGLTVAAHLVNAIDPSRIALIEPSVHHFYQPLWTLVGGGVFPKEESMRQEADYIPAGVTWIQEYVTAFDPDQNQVVLNASSRDIFGCSKNRQNRIVENSTYPLDDFGFR